MTEIKVVAAAKILKRNPSTVAKMIRAGDLTAHKRGKTWYLNEDYVRRVAATMPTSEEASRGNLVNGRLPGKVSKPAAKPLPESHPWAKPKPVQGAHETSMQRAIDKHLPAHAETMARVNAIRTRIGMEVWPV